MTLPTPTVPTANAWELRKLAESAHGERTRTLDLVVRNGGLALVHRAAAGDTVVCHVNTPPSRVAADRPDAALRSVKVTGPTGEEVEVAQTYDALFWTESSIEKFFLPYYAGVLNHEDYATLAGSFYTPSAGQERIVAFGHIPWTRYCAVGEAGSTLALNGAGMLERVQVLSTMGDGQVTERPLGSWLSYVRTLPA
ncbi:MAG: hypothetical protein JNL26_03065 [Gemmatimonadetes bacterium]|nr:hypothetical protein [Gemmatimonadota bacterium]